jgi:hypothetical protein
MSRHPSEMSPGERTPRPSDYHASVELLRRDTVRRVRDDMHGQPAALVHQVLVDRLRGRLPGIDVDEKQMRRVAWAIEHGVVAGAAGKR